MMTIERPAYELNVDEELLDHTKHLPETVECKCGYRRDTAATLAE